MKDDTFPSTAETVAQVKRSLSEIGIEARQQAFKHDLPVVYEKNGKLVKEFADGRIEDYVPE